MNEVFSFGSYYPGDSPLHKCDARTKLTLGFVFLIVALMAQGFAGLGVIAVFPSVFGALSGIYGLSLGGTSIMIVVGVALETTKAMEAQMLMRHYKGFLE